MDVGLGPSVETAFFTGHGAQDVPPVSPIFAIKTIGGYEDIGDHDLCRAHRGRAKTFMFKCIHMHQEGNPAICTATPTLPP